MSVKNAYECKEKYNRDGQCLTRERVVGPIVVWAVVALAALFLGRAMPTSFWQFLK